jgi:hypothetical protein
MRFGGSLQRRVARRAGSALTTSMLILVLLSVAAPMAFGATLSGKVSGQASGSPPAPIAGAGISVLDPVSGEIVATATTSLTGDYSVTVAPAVYDVRFDPAPGQLLGATTARGVDLGTDQVLDVVLIPTGLVRVSGVVRDASGLPVAGATVSLPGGGGVTGADGSYSVTATPGTGRRLTVGGTGLPGLPSSWSLVSSTFTLQGDTTRDVALPPAVEVKVRVVGDDDSPLEGVEVRLPTYARSGTFGDLTGNLSSGADAKRMTDASGEVSTPTFGGAPQSSSHEVRPPEGSPYGTTTYASPTVMADTTIVVRPPRLARITGVVRDAGGLPVAGATIFLPGAGGGGVTGADGSYSVMATPGTGRRLMVGGTGLSGLPSSWSLTSSTFTLDGDIVRDVALPSTVEVEVRVLGESDEPLEGVEVRLPTYARSGTFGDLTGSLSSGADAKRMTDAGGEVSTPTFGGAPQNSSHEVRPPDGSGYGTTTYASPTVAEDTTIVVHPPRQVRVSGVVRDADGSPVPGASVSMPGGGGTTGADGSYSITATPGTGRRLTIVGGPTLPGSIVSSPFSLQSDAVRDVVFPPLVRVTVRTLGNDDEPLEGVEVRIPVFELAGTFGDVAGDAISGGSKYLTDADGEVNRMVFGGEPQSDSNEVRPPEGSGYGSTTYAMPTVTTDTTVVLRFHANDDLAPRISFEAQPNGLGGWFVQPPGSATAVAVDATIASLECTLDGDPDGDALAADPGTLRLGFSATREGRHPIDCVATDEAGHTATASGAILIDRRRPRRPLAVADREPEFSGGGGWYRDQVTVSFVDRGDPDLADGSPGSGVDLATSTQPQTLDTSGVHHVTGSAADVAGNRSQNRSLTVRVDADPPTSELTCPVDPALGSTARARWRDADDESGIDGPARGNIRVDTGTLGMHTVTHTAVDDVGHETSSSCVYRVVDDS